VVQLSLAARKIFLSDVSGASKALSVKAYLNKRPHRQWHQSSRSVVFKSKGKVNVINVSRDVQPGKLRFDRIVGFCQMTFYFQCRRLV
jgi:hypothetical protein